MAADQDKSLCRGGSFYAEDSFLLSDYLHRQAKKACNRFFNHTNSLLFLRSSLILLESQQKEEEEISDRSCPPVLKSMPVGISTAHKDTSESLTDRECSSHELEQERGDSSSPHRTLASSVSYIESSECCESEFAAEAATRIEAIAESLCNGMLCHESKQAISLSNDREEDADDENGVLTTGLGNTEALNFLVIAAMQVDNDDEDVDFNYNVALRASKSADSPSKAGHDALPVHGNCPILKKNMICRARSALQKKNCDDSWQRLEISEAVTRVFESKGEGGAEHHMADLEAAQMKHKGFTTRYRQRKLRDLSLDPSYVLGTACTDVDVDLEGKHGEENNWPNRCFGEVSDVGKESGNLQVLPSKLPSSLSTEGSETAHRREGNCGFFVDHRKLQVLSARVSNACNAENLKGSQMQGGQPRIWSKRENSQAFSTSNKCGRQFVASNGATKACCASKEKRKSSMKKLESQEEEEAHTPLEDTLKNGNSVLRLKILPIRLPNADLPLLEEVTKSESTEVIVEDRMVTRKRRSSRVAETVVASASRLHKALPMPNTQMKARDPVIRTKRGRSHVLPTKFSDSVLQPWRSSRKKCKSSF